MVREEKRKRFIEGSETGQQFELTTEYSQSIKTATYAVFGQIQEKTIYNSEGTPYKVEQTKFNVRGQKVEVNERFRRANSLVKTLYF